MHQRRRCGFVSALFALLVPPLVGASWAQSLPPWMSTHDVPFGLRSLPKHGIYIAGGVGCGLRPPEWGRQYRDIVEAAVSRRAEKPSDAAVTMRAVGAFEDYARQAIRQDRRGFCRSISLQELEDSDRIIHRRREPN